MTVPSGNICFVSSNLDVSLDFVSENIEILGKQNRCFPREQSLSVYCYIASAFSTQMRALIG